MQRNPPLSLICEDAPLIAVNKPSGVISQGAPAGLQSLAEQVKEYLKQKYNKPGNVYLGIPHRLDRPVSGVSVFCRNSKSAARLSEQFAKRTVQKIYRVVVEGTPPDPEGVLEDWIYRIPDHSRVEIRPPGSAGAKQASLNYHLLESQQGKSLIEVNLKTGRMHQIRIQFASRGCPVVGDTKYGATTSLANPSAIALHAWRLQLAHPIRKEPLSITAPLPAAWSAFGFKFTL